MFYYCVKIIAYHIAVTPFKLYRMMFSLLTHFMKKSIFSCLILFFSAITLSAQTEAPKLYSIGRHVLCYLKPIGYESIQPAVFPLYFQEINPLLSPSNWEIQKRGNALLPSQKAIKPEIILGGIPADIGYK